MDRVPGIGPGDGDGWLKAVQKRLEEKEIKNG